MCKLIAKCSVLAAMLTLFCMGSWAQSAYSIDYFPNLNKSNGLKKVINTGFYGDTLAGDVCDLIFVFHKEQLTECCGCYVTPNGSRDFDVNKNFNSNNLLGAPFAEIIVKQVATGPQGATSDAQCDPTVTQTVKPNSLISWAVKTQVVGTSTGITETASQQATLGTAEYNDLIEDCNVLTELGSGQGICSCGTFD